jgi:hypothetical protein
VQRISDYSVFLVIKKKTRENVAAKSDQSEYRQEVSSSILSSLRKKNVVFDHISSLKSCENVLDSRQNSWTTEADVTDEFHISVGNLHTNDP